jgi:hypothetical protein
MSGKEERDEGRRKALQMIGTGMAGISGLASTGQGLKPNEETKLTGQEKRESIKEAKKNREVRKLSRSLKKGGWKVVPKEADVFEFSSSTVSDEVFTDVVSRSEKLRTVVIPVKEKPGRGNKAESTVDWEIVWNSLPVDHTTPKEYQRVYASKRITGEETARVERYYVEDGTVKHLDSAGLVVEEQAESSDKVETSAVCTTGDYKLYCKQLGSVQIRIEG